MEMRQHSLAPRRVRKYDHAGEPNNAFALHGSHGAGESVFSDKVVQVDSDSRIDLVGQIRHSAGHREVAQSVRNATGVTVEPVEFSAIDGIHHAVLTRDLSVQE